MKNGKKSAKEAAQFVVEHPGIIQTHNIRAMIPEYKTALPVNSWIAAFKRALPEHLWETFADLTWQKQKEYMQENK